MREHEEQLNPRHRINKTFKNIRTKILMRVFMKKGLSKLVIVAIILIAIIIGAIAIYYFSQNGTVKQDVFTVQNATSLQVSADVVGGNQGSFLFSWSVANIGTTNQKIRLTINGGQSGNFSYIVKAGDQTAWKNEDGTWVSVNYTELNTLWGTAWTENLNQLKANWTGNGNVSFTNSIGDHVTITNVVINPKLADSVFEPTT
jgi:hypothetical protein